MTTAGDAPARDIAVDVVVIGAGPVGENVADRAVQGGLTVAIVERELVGGECSYWACMPTKALLRDAAALRAARALPGAAAAITGSLDVDEVLRRRDRFASHWKDDGQVSWLTGAGITLVRGHGRLAGDRTVEVTDEGGRLRTIHARRAVVVATGSRAHLPQIPGLREARPWTNREAAAAESIPARLAILGGGVVGVEMSTAFAALGSRVTLIARSGLLTTVEPFASDMVTQSLAGAGVALQVDVEPARVQRNSSGTIDIALSSGESIGADELLVAAGREPRTDDLGVESVGLAPGRWLTVDDALQVIDDDGARVGDGWLYAVGDVNHRVLLTHQGKYQARAVGDAIAAAAAGTPVDLSAWGRHAATADQRAVPQVIFADPEIATVGRTAAAATAAGLRIRAVEYDLASVAGASVHGNDFQGRASMVVDLDRNVLVGFTVVGPDVAELLQAATIAIVGEVPLDRLWHAVPAFPTMNEIWLRLLETFGRPD